MKVMFMGTPDFAVYSLEALIGAGHEIASVITMPDKPKGRGHKMMHTPVYEAAESHNIPVLTPENLKKETFEAHLTEVSPDVIVVVAYGKILPEYVLDFPKYGCINVHGSLLPKYRGAAPIQRSIIDGETITGITTMYMEKGLDTGDMLLKSEVEITPDDNYESLHDKLADSGAKLIVETLKELEDGSCTTEKQDDSKSCYAHMITKETACIDWTKNAKDVHNLVRGLYPVPKAFTSFFEKNMKIGLTKVSDKSSDFLPGTIFEITKNSFFVSCGESTSIEVLMIQPEGKKMMSVEDYLKGNVIEKSVVLGG